MNILFLSRWFPYPPDNGSKIRIYHLIEALAKAHVVDLVSFSAETVRPEHAQGMLSLCRSVDSVVYRPFHPTRVRALLGYFSRKPRFLVDTYQKEFAAILQAKARREAYDLVIASQIDMTPYACEINGPARIFEEVEVSQALDLLRSRRSRISTWRNSLTLWKLSSYINSLSHTFDGFTTVSRKECENLARMTALNSKVQVIPNGVDADRLPARGLLPKRDTLIYSGALTYQANFDAVDYFLREIFPLIRKKRPGVRLYVTGSVKGVDLSRLPRAEGVVFTGYLPDVARQVAESWVSVVPLRVGGGTRLKILEALSLGTPVVSTSKGIEGLDLEPGREVLIGDDAGTFAAQVLRILDDEPLRMKLGQAGRQLVCQAYNWKDIESEFRVYVESVVSKRSIH